MDKNSFTFAEMVQVLSLSVYLIVPIEAVTCKTSDICANFENLAKGRGQEDRQKAETERVQKMAKESQE
jgi:cortactin